MSRICRRLLIVCLPVALAAGCERAKSINPLSPNVAGPIAGVSIQSPKAVDPAPSAQIASDQQPVVLTIQNAVTSGVRPLSYVFEIALDAAFSSKVFSQTGVQPGANGQTSFRMPDSLAAEHTYFWRSKADDGANASDYSAPVSFRVFTPVIIQPPGLLDPAEGVTVASTRPTLTVSNAQRTGPAGAMQYLFEVAIDASMANRVLTVLVNESGGQTSYSIPDALLASTRYFWRTKATDPGHQSDYSTIRSFVTPAVVSNPTPPPPTTPLPGGGGGAGVDAINMSQATIQNSPVDIANWPITTALSTVDIRSSGVSVDFSKKDGPGRWPDIVPPGWTGPLEYTLGMCLNIGGHWYCSAVVEDRNGLAEAGGPPGQFALNWFYDAGRWGPMTGHQPSVGEQIGFYVCAGDCRNNPHGDASPVHERSNVVLVSMPGAGGAIYRF